MALAQVTPVQSDLLSRLGLNVPMAPMDLFSLPLGIAPGLIGEIARELTEKGLIAVKDGGYVRVPRNWGRPLYDALNDLTNDVFLSLEKPEERYCHTRSVPYKDWVGPIFYTKKRGRKISVMLEENEIPVHMEYTETINIMKDNPTTRFCILGIPQHIRDRIFENHPLKEIQGWICWSWQHKEK